MLKIKTLILNLKEGPEMTKTIETSPVDVVRAI